ncbi:MAG: hypothetical protein CL840_05725 [Crocinitomicaceae bacterium]|nr:hypothetical protein [Crocinitomicaceae bacterium]
MKFFAMSSQSLTRRESDSSTILFPLSFFPQKRKFVKKKLLTYKKIIPLCCMYQVQLSDLRASSQLLSFTRHILLYLNNFLKGQSFDQK